MSKAVPVISIILCVIGLGIACNSRENEVLTLRYCGGCEIDGKCYQHFDRNPENICQHCDIYKSKTKWITVPDGQICTDWDDTNGYEFCKRGKCSVNTAMKGLYSSNDNSYCNGYFIFNPVTKKNDVHDPPCREDGNICNGLMDCIEEPDSYKGFRCVTEFLCREDEFYCNGIEICNEEKNRCERIDVPCPENGLWCDGYTYCDEETHSCITTSPPCGEDEYCNEIYHVCEPKRVDTSGNTDSPQN